MAHEKDQQITNVESGQVSPRHDLDQPAVDRPAQDDVRVTAKTWVVVAILSFGYGLSFIPVPVMVSY